MALTDFDRRLLAATEDGLPIQPRPYAAVAAELCCSEDDVIGGLRRLIESGIVSRFGVVVRHHELGYRANAMVVWDVPDDRLADAGRRLAALPYVTLCYRRPRRPPDWPYSLFCMIHGRDRSEVEELVRQAASACDLTEVAHDILFSTRRFKQRGARYGTTTVAEHQGIA
jgi:DNA-binding Lrp family transcriptional regulator